MFDVNQARTLDALTKWWNEFRDLAPVADDEVNKFCCVFVGNKIDIVPASTNGVIGPYSGRSTPPERIHEVRIHEFIDTLIPPCTLSEPSASESSVVVRTHDSVDSIPVVDRPLSDGPPTHSSSPPRTNSSATCTSLVWLVQLTDAAVGFTLPRLSTWHHRCSPSPCQKYISISTATLSTQSGSLPRIYLDNSLRSQPQPTV